MVPTEKGVRGAEASNEPEFSCSESFQLTGSIQSPRPSHPSPRHSQGQRKSSASPRAPRQINPPNKNLPFYPTPQLAGTVGIRQRVPEQPLRLPSSNNARAGSPPVACVNMYGSPVGSQATIVGLRPREGHCEALWLIKGHSGAKLASSRHTESPWGGVH